MSVVEDARRGNIDAIAQLLNQTLQTKHIHATLSAEHGCLDIMLDAQALPNESVADFITKGLLKLGIENIYDLNIYGRTSGEVFATWSKHILLKARPVDMPSSSIGHTDLPMRDRQRNERSITISVDDGQQVTLDLAQLLGLLGVGALVVGIYCPMVSLPIVGTLTYFRGGHGDAFLLIGFAVASLYLIVQRCYVWLYGSGVGASLLVSGTFFYLQHTISELKAEVDRELAGNPFRGIADLAMANTRLEWGWFLLFLGCGLILAAAYLKQRRLTKRAFETMGVAIGIIVLSMIVQAMVSDIALFAQVNSIDVSRAKESEAKQYVGSMNRAQQAYFLENERFAPTIAGLGLGLSEETSNYTYRVSADTQRAIATAVPKTRGLKSFIGGVFLDHSGEYSTTKALICESKRNMKRAPATPTISSTGELQCGSDSVNLR